MKHSSSRELFAYWNKQRGFRPVPDRAEIEPGAIRGVLGDTFILSVTPRSEYPFRLAGKRVCALFCRELRDELFPSLWMEEGRAEISARVGIVVNESVGLVANAQAKNAEGATLELELLLLPLALRGNARARIIGTLVPRESPYWLGISPVVSLTLGSFRHLNAEIERDAPLLVTGAMATELALNEHNNSGNRTGLPASFPSLPSSTRLQRGLRVYDGGRVE